VSHALGGTSPLNQVIPIIPLSARFWAPVTSTGSLFHDRRPPGDIVRSRKATGRRANSRIETQFLLSQSLPPSSHLRSRFGGHVLTDERSLEFNGIRLRPSKASDRSLILPIMDSRASREPPFGSGQWVLMQDGAPPHTAHETLDYISQHCPIGPEFPGPQPNRDDLGNSSGQTQLVNDHYSSNGY
jgi:hypothetical protein